jgi:hypothetical protein
VHFWGQLGESISRMFVNNANNLRVQGKSRSGIASKFSSHGFIHRRQRV